MQALFLRFAKTFESQKYSTGPGFDWDVPILDGFHAPRKDLKWSVFPEMCRFDPFGVSPS